MSKRSWQGNSIRTTITIPRKLHKKLRKTMIDHGYGDNFSAFMCESAREKQARLMNAGMLAEVTTPQQKRSKR